MTSIRTCALAAAAVSFIGSQASAQGGPQGGPAVTVANTPLPVTVTNQAVSGTPVAFFLNQATPNFMVPPAQRLVIEYVSGRCSLAQLLAPEVAIFIATNGVTVDHTIAMPTGFMPPAQVVVSVGQVVKLYADPGTQVTLATFPTNPVLCSFAFSGQLVKP
jgi:hypothetical protein